jgi:porin
MKRLFRIEGFENKKSPVFMYFKTLLIDQPNNFMSFLIASRLLLICGVFNCGFPQLGLAYEQVNSAVIAEAHGERQLNFSTELGFSRESLPQFENIGIKEISMPLAPSLINNALALPPWILIDFTALSQNNGALTGTKIPLFTSSNLFNLGIKIVPFYSGNTLLSSLANGTKPVDSNASKIFNNSSIYALFTQRVGQILSSEIPNILNTQWNFGNAPIGRLNILALQYESKKDFLSLVKVGKLMQATDFTVNPVQCYFSNFGLCGWAQGTPTMIQIPGNPFNSYGAVFRLGSEGYPSLKYGIYQINPDSFNPIYHGLDFRLSGNIGYAQFLQINLPLKSYEKIAAKIDINRSVFRVTKKGPEINAEYVSPLPKPEIQIGGWLGSGSFSGVSDSKSYGQNNGVYGIVSLPIDPGGLGMDARFFVSGGYGFNTQVQTVNAGGSAGLVLAGPFSSRPFDTLSLGWSFAKFSEYSSSYSPLGTEQSIELNYQYFLTNRLSLMPNLQLIINPSGDPLGRSVFVLGLQSQLRL